MRHISNIFYLLIFAACALFGATIEPTWFGKKTHYKYFASIDKKVLEVARAAVIYIEVYLMHARRNIR